MTFENKAPVAAPSEKGLTKVMPNCASTIGEAAQKYKSFGENSVYPAYRGLIHKMIDAGIKTDFDNDSYLDALFLTELMFNRSENKIRLFTGSHCNDFLKILAKPFQNALERVKLSNGSVKIILLGSQVPIWLSDLKSQYPEVLDIVLAKALEPVRHFILCDSKMARLEEPHDELTDKTPATAIKAKVYFNDPHKCKTLDVLFDAMWDRLKSQKQAAP